MVVFVSSCAMLGRKKIKKPIIMPILQKASSSDKAFYQTAGLKMIKITKAKATTIILVNIVWFAMKWVLTKVRTDNLSKMKAE